MLVGGVGAYVAQVDRLLAGGQALFARGVGPGVGLGAVGGGGPVAPAGVSGLSGGVAAAAEGYRGSWASVAGVDGDAAATAGAGAAAGRVGRAGAGGVRESARSAAAAIAPALGSPAGVRLLVSAMDDRMAAMQRQIDTARAQNTVLAARMRQLAMAYRSMGYRSMAGGGATTPAMSGFGGAMPATGFGGGMPATSALAAGGGIPGMSPAPAGGDSAAADARFPAIAGGLNRLSLNSSPREVAAAIIAEARRRGYSRRQAVAILSTAMQESNLNPRAVSPNRLWKSIFQQDAGYRDRDDPNAVIAQFFDRLEHHGGPRSRDIWKTIFWLQQRPADPSAEIAYRRGRRAYLTEIRSQEDRAERMFMVITGAAG